MSMYSMASLFSSSPSTHSIHHHISLPKTTLALKPYHHQYLLLSFKLDKIYRNNLLLCSVSDNNNNNVEASAAAISTATQEPPPPAAAADAVVVKEESLSSNGSAPNKKVEGVEFPISEVKFEEPRWVNGTWNLFKFQKDGKTNWDALIDAEARRRKWLESNPESSNNDEPVMFDTSIIPWWAWIKRFHLPEAELLNGRAAMVGFFMAYFVDGLTGVGLVDQMDNFFCKTLLFIAVAGVLLIRKNEDFDNLKMLLEETTFYDKQWQATWKDETSSNSKNKQ